MLGTNHSSRLSRRRRVPPRLSREAARREASQSPTPISRFERQAADVALQRLQGRRDRHPAISQIQQSVTPFAESERLTQTQRGRAQHSGNGISSRQRFNLKSLLFRASTPPPLPSLKPLSRPEQSLRPDQSPRPQPGLRPVERSAKNASTQSLQTRRGRVAQTEPNRLHGRATELRPLRSQPVLTAPKSRSLRRPRRPASPLLHIVRLGILGIGISAIAGTVLSVFNPALRQGELSQVAQMTLTQTSNPPANSDSSAAVTSSAAPAILRLGDRLTTLETTIQTLTAQYSGLTPGVFMVDSDTDAYLDLNGSSIFSAASMIKVPILVALLQDVDAGKIRLDEPLTMRPADIASGSGELQYQPPGSRYTVLETVSEMITISDNTATNMLIARLGGIETVNQRFRQWGLTNTAIHHLLPDLEGTNTTTPRELVELMARINQGDLLSIRSRDRMLDIMRHTITNTLLPAGLDAQATVAHKTGDIGSMVGDVGLIDASNGKRYVITVMVQRPHNDNRAQELIRRISRAVYGTINQPTTVADEAPSAAANAAQITTNSANATAPVEGLTDAPASPQEIR